MRNFKFLFVFAIVAIASLTIFSCTSDTNSIIKNDDNQVTESRSTACPKPKLSLETVLGSPCASLKLVYDGTEDPASTCIMKSIDVKIFKTWNLNEVLNFKSPIFNSPPNTPYPFNSSWVSLRSGGLVNLGGQTIGAFNITSLITNVNGKFEYFIQSTPTMGYKTFVCIETIMECDGMECPNQQCFDAFTPCL